MFVFVYVVWIAPILGFMLFSVPQLDRASPAPPKRCFICMIPAYNEETVIGNPVPACWRRNIRRSSSGLVIFDGSDGTAEIALTLGAQVSVTPTTATAHRVLDYAFRKLSRDRDHRYVAVFDADNVVGSNYLQAMKNAIETKGFASCIVHDVLNGADNWITKALWCSCVASSRMYLTGRMRSLKTS